MQAEIQQQESQLKIFDSRDIYNYYLVEKGLSLERKKDINNKIKSSKAVLARKTTKPEKKKELKLLISKLERELNKYSIDYTIFLSILKDFNDEVLDEVCKGKTFVLGFRLGWFRIIKRKHNLNKKRINYNETKKQGKTILYTDKYYLDFNWVKRKCYVLNSKAYRFTGSYSDTHKNGSKDRLRKLMKDNEFYKFDLL